MPPRFTGEMLNRLPALFILVDEAGRLLDVNDAALAMIGLDRDSAGGVSLPPLLSAPEQTSLFVRSLRHAAQSGHSGSCEYDLPPSGAGRRSIAWTIARVTEDPMLLACVGVDVTAARSAADSLLAQALTDQLTGLPNRAHLLQNLARMKGSGASVLFCDLNGFKAVNDTFGHATGDAVLVEVARRLTRAVRGEDFVARLGGDEFVVVAPPNAMTSPEGLTRRILSAMRQPMLLAGGVVAVVGVSIGTAELEPGQEPSAVLEQADARMYSAKSLRTSTAAALPGSRP